MDHKRSRVRVLCITHGLESIMGCILSTVHCRSQHCLELLHPFAHQGQHGRNHSQHCWANNVGSCCIRLNTIANTYATTPNVVGPTMLGVLRLFVRELTGWRHVRPRQGRLGTRNEAVSEVVFGSAQLCSWGITLFFRIKQASDNVHHRKLKALFCDRLLKEPRRVKS